MNKKAMMRTILYFALLLAIFNVLGFFRIGIDGKTKEWTIIIAQGPMIKFLNSNFFNATITFTVGFLAWIIYEKQKDDFKKDAANIILQELQNAERSLKIAKKSLSQNQIEEDSFLMRSESWSKYKYLFVGDFNRDQWDTITDFYNRSARYDDAVKSNNSTSEKNQDQLRTNIQKIAANFVNQSYPNIITANEEELKIIIKEIHNKNKKFMDVYLASAIAYIPDYSILLARRAIDNLNSELTISEIGTRLRKLAGLKE